MKRITTLALISALFISLHAYTADALPEVFKGTWNSNCEVSDDIDAISMDSDEFGYWEKIAKVKSIKVTSDSEISASLHFLDNDGSEWDETRSYKITEQKLVETINIPDTAKQHMEIRLRCQQTE